MSKAEKVGAFILLIFCVVYLVVFGWLIFLMPAYGTGVLNGR